MWLCQQTKKVLLDNNPLNFLKNGINRWKSDSNSNEKYRYKENSYQ